MELLLALIFFPLIPAVLLYLIRNAAVQTLIIRLSSLVIIVLSVLVAVQYTNHKTYVDMSKYGFINYGMMCIEVLIALYIIYTGIKKKFILAPIFSFLATAIIIIFEFTVVHQHHLETDQGIMIDNLSTLMIAIIGIVGSLICLYTAEYMKDYHKYHTVEDNRHMFFAVLFAFMSAMFGLVIANNLMWLFFCWEVTTFCSFLLIGYTKSEVAVKNSFLALTINAGGGLVFAIAIALLGTYFGKIDMESLLSLDNPGGLLTVIVFFMAFAGLTKSAQMPFSKWLLGAMVAPTPSSAMLHSSTMVKAGVYLIIRLSPMLGHNFTGVTMTLVGGFTFFVGALIAISQSDAKKILAYSTVSNLGLIVACASIGTEESIWAAIMLIIFHAIAKSLLFLSVGSTEHFIGSRNVEDMEGLIGVSGPLTMFLIIGIAGMFLAPFGMLISKWAAMKAFIDSGNIFIVLLVAFGSSVTLFFWTKWLGKLIEGYTTAKLSDYKMNFDEKVTLYSLAILVVFVCLGFPIISDVIILPYLTDNSFLAAISPINSLDTTIVLFMMCILFIIPILLMPVYKKYKVQPTSIYMGGHNTGDNVSFIDSMGQVKKVENRNWYMNNLFGEDVLLNKSIAIAAAIIIIGAFVTIGGNLL